MSREPQQNPAGAEADLLVAFVNTRDVEEGTDSISTPVELAGWIEEHGGDAGEVDTAAHAGTLRLRESLRALLRANNGYEMQPAELAGLSDATERVRFRTAVAGDGNLDLVPAGGGAEALQGRLLLAVERLQCLDLWHRLKACPADDCQWAFFDATRNRSRTWCSMEVCGNREKTRRYRGRRSSVSGD